MTIARRPDSLPSDPLLIGCLLEVDRRGGVEHFDRSHAEIGLHESGRSRSGRRGCLRARRGPPRGHIRIRPTRAPRPRVARPAAPSALVWRRISTSRSKMKSAMTGDRPIEGSSSISSLGEDARPRPIASICCSPPDSVPAIWPLRSARRRHPVQDPFEIGLPVASSRRGARADLEVLQHRQRREDLPALGHMGDAEVRTKRRANLADVDPFEADRSAGGLQDAGDRLEQRRLARAVRTRRPPPAVRARP